MATKLKAELNKVKQKDFEKEERLQTIISETNQLLLESQKEDEEIKRNLNIHRNVDFERGTTQSLKKVRAYEHIYKEESFTGSQIKELCNKYDLRILSISKYTGKIPVELYRKIREFKESVTDQKVRITDENFFILAPVEMFETVKVEHIKDLDPIVFYREEVGNLYSSNKNKIVEYDVLTKVYDWGNDFSISRSFRFLLNNYIQDREHTSVRTVNIYTLLVMIFLFLVSISMKFPFELIATGYALLSTCFFVNSRGKKYYDDLWNSDKI